MPSASNSPTRRISRRGEETRSPILAAGPGRPWGREAERTSGAAEVEARVEATLIEDLYVRLKSAGLVLLGVLCSLRLIASDAFEARRDVRITFYALLALILARIAHVRLPEAFWARHGGAAAKRRPMEAAAFATSVGFAILNVLTYRQMALNDAMVWAMAMCLLVSGAISSLGSHPRIFLLYVVPNLGSLAFLALTDARPGGRVTGAGMILWGAFIVGQMRDLSRSRRRLVQLNLDLDGKVRELDSARHDAERKNAQLSVKNRDMRLVLDHIGQGLFMADADGFISAQRSRALDDLLGRPEPGATLWSYLSSVDAATGAWLRLGWETLKEGLLPLELALDQLPKSIHKGTRHFKIEYEPIVVEMEMTKLLVVISDVTAQLARERADASQRELIALFERVSRDRAGVQEFFVEGANLVHRILTATTLTPDLLRAIHTLKGNGALFGLTSISDLCHAIEDNIADTGTIPSDGERTELGARWREIVQKISTLLDQVRTARIEIEETDYDSLIQGIVRGVPRRTLAHHVWLWRLEPLSRRLERIAQQARAVAPRLGKANVTILTEHNGLRLDTKAWAPFWAAFVHVVRNALDHGVENEAERTRAGKSGAGTVAIRTYLSGPEFIVEVADDGRGVDWEGVRARGMELRLPHQTRQELEALLFVDGVSTKTEATEISGRGVGLGAVRAACIALGGEVRLRTTPGEGTVFEFGFPIAAMGDTFAEPEIAPSQSTGALGSRRGRAAASQGAASRNR